MAEMLYTVEATDRDPRLERVDHIEIIRGVPRAKALALARQFQRQGYWASVYAEDGECITEFGMEN